MTLHLHTLQNKICMSPVVVGKPVRKVKVPKAAELEAGGVGS